MRLPRITNATKGALIGLVNATLALIISFGVDVTDEQTAGISGLVNAALIVWILATQKNSPVRIPDGATVVRNDPPSV